MSENQRKPSSKSPEYLSWKSMKARCLNPKATGYSRYGGAGVTICDQWMNFETFFRDMGPRPRGMTLERVDRFKGYYPENCKWASKSEQCNNRRGNVKLTFQGKTMGVYQWARLLGLKPVTLKNRLHLGWSIERALTTQTLYKINFTFEDVAPLRRRGLTYAQIADRLGVKVSSVRYVWTKRGKAKRPSSRCCG